MGLSFLLSLGNALFFVFVLVGNKRIREELLDRFSL
jgi:hypothetical protein